MEVEEVRSFLEMLLEDQEKAKIKRVIAGEFESLKASNHPN